MALTVEEKIDKLKNGQYWDEFTDAQRNFLLNMAASDFALLDSYRKAYPNVKASASTFSAYGMIQSLAVKAALESIGYQREKKEVVSKKEAQELMSYHMRKTGLEPETLVKLMGVYAKLAGWEKEKETDPGEEMSMDKLVAAVEKKRKAVTDGCK